MIAALITVSLLALCAAILLALELRRVSGLYASVYDLLVRERDEVKQEAETLKRALFPQLARMADKKTAPVAAPAMSGEQKIGNILGNRRVPFRLRSKLLSQLTNTKQLGRDRMAAALAPQSAAKDASHA